MGLVKIFGKLIQIGARDLRSDKDFDLANEHFENEIKLYRERGLDEETILKEENRQMAEAYAHLSVKSAFWWLEHYDSTSIKLKLLHIKFKSSLEHEPYYRCKNNVTRELQEKFVAMTLKKIDYPIIGFADESACVKKIMESYYKQRQSKDSIIRRNASPFMTFEYWLCCIYKQLLEEGKSLTDESVYQDYLKWFNEYIKYFDTLYYDKYYGRELFGMSSLDYDKL